MLTFVIHLNNYITYQIIHFFIFRKKVIITNVTSIKYETKCSTVVSLVSLYCNTS